MVLAELGRNDEGPPGSKEEAVGWSKKFVDIFIDAGLDVEVDVRRAYEGPKAI